MSSRLKRGRREENIVVGRYYKDGSIATRIGGSGSGRFKGDILAFCKNPPAIELSHVRRTKKEEMLFDAQELHDVWKTMSQLHETFGSLLRVDVCLHCHFPNKRLWAKILLLKYHSGEIIVTDSLKVKCAKDVEYLLV